MAAPPNPLNSALPAYQQQAGSIMAQPVSFQLHVKLPLFHCLQPEADIFGCRVSGVYFREDSCPPALGQCGLEGSRRSTPSCSPGGAAPAWLRSKHLTEPKSFPSSGSKVWEHLTCHLQPLSHNSHLSKALKGVEKRCEYRESRVSSPLHDIFAQTIKSIRRKKKL